MPREISWKPRLIHPSSATSGSLAQLSPLTELLFWRMLPQADDQGRLTGEPKLLKVITCPIREEITAENIPSLLEELEQEKAQLIIRYHKSGNELIQIRNWWAYQSMQWAYPSKYPPPEGWADHLRYRKGGKVITNNWPPETESESLAVVASDKGLEDIVAKLSQNYEKEIGVISPTIAAELADFGQYYRARDAPIEWLEEAFAAAARNNKRSWAYVKKVLTNWIDKGRGTKAKEEEIEEQWSRKQKTALQ